MSSGIKRGGLWIEFRHLLAEWTLSWAIWLTPGERNKALLALCIVAYFHKTGGIDPRSQALAKNHD